MRTPRPWSLVLSLWMGLAVLPPAQAQWLPAVFPEGVPGQDASAGVTVKSRARPAFAPLGIRIGTALLRPALTVSTGYDDNIFGGPERTGGWRLTTSPSFLLGTAWADSSLGLFLSADDTRYPEQPSQNRTDATAFLGGTLDIGRGKLTLGAGYAARHQDRTELDALPSDRPVAFQVGTLRAAHAMNFGRFTVTPAAEFNHWRFDNTTIRGVPVNQSTRDRAAAQGGATLRYAWMPAREMVLVTRVLDTRYDHPAAGTPSNNSLSYQILLGLEYDDNTVWRYRLLGGAQHRAPASAAFQSQTTGIAEAEIVWSPSGLTTLRATATRGIEDAAQSGLSSFTYTSARLTLDHEYLRNVLLNASATLRHAAFQQTGGQQWGLSFGAGASWLINRNLSVSLTYDFSDVRARHLPAGAVAGDYTRNLIILSIRTAL